MGLPFNSYHNLFEDDPNSNIVSMQHTGDSNLVGSNLTENEDPFLDYLNNQNNANPIYQLPH